MKDYAAEQASLVLDLNLIWAISLLGDFLGEKGWNEDALHAGLE
jgi:hypothetical protein